MSGLFLFALVSLALACADNDGPDTAGSPVAPELAAKFSCTRFNSLPRYPGEPRPTVAEEICAASGSLMSPNDVQSALVKLVKAINGSGEGLLSSFITLKWKNLPATAEDLEHLLDHIVLAEAGLVSVGAVADKDGDLECVPSGEACAEFDPAWSTQDRIWVESSIACSALEAATTLDVFGVCRHFETRTTGGGSTLGTFAEPVTLVLCYDGPSTLASSVAIAKVFEAPDDPLGTSFEGIEHFTSSAAADPPNCPSASLSRAAGPASGGVGVLAGQKSGGRNGIVLQGGIGTRLSVFSDWGFVDLESAIIQGTISSSEGGNPPIEGATVEIFCEGATTADTTATSEGDGSYSLDNGTTHVFLPGNDCKVKASAGGFFPDSTSTFTVVKGLNELEDLALAPEPVID